MIVYQFLQSLTPKNYRCLCLFYFCHYLCSVSLNLLFLSQAHVEKHFYLIKILSDIIPKVLGNFFYIVTLVRPVTLNITHNAQDSLTRQAIQFQLFLHMLLTLTRSKSSDVFLLQSSASKGYNLVISAQLMSLMIAKTAITQMISTVSAIHCCCCNLAYWFFVSILFTYITKCFSYLWFLQHSHLY